MPLSKILQSVEAFWVFLIWYSVCRLWRYFLGARGDVQLTLLPQRIPRQQGVCVHHQPVPGVHHHPQLQRI